jgi:UDP-GlcNAc3NAcA epimerase
MPSRTKKLVTVVGARPQFVKAAVVSQALSRHSEFSEVLVHTGQHFDDNMSAVFFDELSIPQPAYNLGIGGGTHGVNTGRAIEAIERVLIDEKPDWVVVYGDTDSTLAGAIAAAKLEIRVAHVEAGLRSFNRAMPEEINRVLTDHVSQLLFVPSKAAIDNLANEGITGPSVQWVGDVMYDAVKVYSDVADRRSIVLRQLELSDGGYVLVTLHRKENVENPARLTSILRGLAQSRWPVVLPLHPRTRKKIGELELKIGSRIRLIDPIGYLDMMSLEKHARAIATDSGGVQKEAYFHGVPCITLRDETEWVELVDIGVNRLVGSDADAIAAALEAPHPPVPRAIDLYGSGDAAERIADGMKRADIA